MRPRHALVLSLAAAIGFAAVGGTFAGREAQAAPRARDPKPAAARADDLVAARWRSVKDLSVAPRSDDAEYLRRVTLDLTGTIPTEAETVAFLADASPDKRAALVDRLLLTERHGDWFATWYGNLLVGTALRNRSINRRTFNEWLRAQFRANRPYDELVHDLITASGNSDENGAVGFVSSFETSAADATGKTARFFLGVQVQCAQCHDHPYDKRIKQEDFASFAAFWFTTTHRRNQSPGSPEISFDIQSWPLEDLRGGRVRTLVATGMRPGQPLRLEAAQARPGRGPLDVPEAKFLLGKVLKDVPGVDRRTLLAKWVTSRQNPWFAPAFANRLWAWFLGRGIVHPVDDFSSSNRPTNPELLAHLAEEFEASGFDVRHLIRVITATEAYQRSSRLPREQERPDPALYAVGAVRPLSVEQSFDALFRATGYEKEVERRLAAVRLAQRAQGPAQLADPRMAIYQQFRRSFDDDEQAEEEAFTGTIPRGLLMMNGTEVNRMISAADSPLRAILREEKGDRERVRRVYLTVLSREPSPGEQRQALQHVHTSRTETEGYEDLLWALVNTTEFMSNH